MRPSRARHNRAPAALVPSARAARQHDWEGAFMRSSLRNLNLPEKARVSSRAETAAPRPWATASSASVALRQARKLISDLISS